MEAILEFDFYRVVDGTLILVGSGLFDLEYLDLYNVTIRMEGDTYDIIARLLMDGLYEGRVNGLAWGLRE